MPKVSKAKKPTPKVIPAKKPVKPNSRQNIVAAVAEQLGLSKRQTDHLFKLFLDAMAEELQQEGRVFLKELGSFDVITKQSREVYHPVTGKPIKTRTRKTVHYIPSRPLEYTLN